MGVDLTCCVMRCYVTHAACFLLRICLRQLQTGQPSLTFMCVTICMGGKRTPNLLVSGCGGYRSSTVIHGPVAVFNLLFSIWKRGTLQ